MKEIPVSKRNPIIAAILAVVITAGISVIENLPRHTKQGTNLSSSEESLVSSAVVMAVEKVFQVNYQEGKHI